MTDPTTIYPNHLTEPKKKTTPKRPRHNNKTPKTQNLFKLLNMKEICCWCRTRGAIKHALYQNGKSDLVVRTMCCCYAVYLCTGHADL